MRAIILSCGRLGPQLNYLSRTEHTSGQSLVAGTARQMRCQPRSSCVRAANPASLPGSARSTSWRASSVMVVHRMTSCTVRPHPSQMPAALSWRQTLMQGVSTRATRQPRATGAGTTSTRCEGGLPTKFFSSARSFSMYSGAPQAALAWSSESNQNSEIPS